MTPDRMQRFQKDRLARGSRHPLFLIFVTLTAALTGIMTFGLVYWHDLSEAAFDREQLRTCANAWELAKTATATRLWALARLAGIEDQVLPLFAAGQRERLAAVMAPWFQTLRNTRQLTRLDFIQADRRVLLRMEAPEDFGDVVVGAPLLAAERSHVASSGLVAGAGGVGFELVVPLLQGGAITGFLDLGADLDAVLGELGTAVEADFVLLVDKGLADFRAAPGAAPGAVRPPWRPAGWDRFADLVVAAESRPGLAEGLVPGPADRMTRGERSLTVVSVPVAEAGGRPIGRLDGILDDGGRRRMGWIALATFVGAVLAAAGLAVVACHVLLYRVQPSLGLSGRQRHDMELVSMRDGLTGLYNRSALESLLARELAHVREAGLPLAVMIVALDDYRLLLETKERGIADKVALAVADSLQHQLRLGDLAVRNGGDGFILVVQRVGGMLARDVAERLRRAISGTRVETGSGLLPLSACLGIACYPESGTVSAELIGAAEQALALARGQGRNQIRMAEV